MILAVAVGAVMFVLATLVVARRLAAPREERDVDTGTAASSGEPAPVAAPAAAQPDGE